MPRLVGTWYFQEETYTGCRKEENARFSLYWLFPGATAVVVSEWRKLLVQFKANGLRAGQQQARGRDYNLNKK